jgi:hypothetical protein
MPDQVDLAVALCIPEIDGEDVEGCVDFTKFYDQIRKESEDIGTHT